MVVDREMRKALLERHDLALGRTIVTLGIDRDHATSLQASIGVLEQHRVRAGLAIDRDVAADAFDQRPLDFARHEHGGVTEEMHAGLGREAGEDREGVEPVEMVGDQHIGAVGGNPFAALDLDTKERMEKGHGPESHRSIRECGLSLYRKKSGGGAGARPHFPSCTPPARKTSRRSTYRSQRAPATTIKATKPRTPAPTSRCLVAADS